MGAWSTSITGNDTAQDLRAEYACAFYYYKDVSEAVQKIEEYVASYGINESDPEEYCDYVYSLADFMWKKGILTEDVRNRALEMIDSDFGLEIWEESGEKILQKRKAVLEKFRKQLISPMGDRKKIRPNVYMNEIFENGDLIAIKLITAGKIYSKKAQWVKEITPERFTDCDGKYVLIQKVGTHVSWRSSIVPEVRDCWAVFRLFDGIYDIIPESISIDDLKDAKFIESNKMTPYFTCESSMYYFNKREYRVLRNYPLPDDRIDVSEDYIRFQYHAKSIFFGIYNDSNDADSDLISAMGNDIIISEYAGGFDALRDVIETAYVNIRDASDLTSEDCKRKRDNEKQMLCLMAEREFLNKDSVYQISFADKMAGFVMLKDNQIKALYVKRRYHNIGFGTKLVEHAIRTTGTELSMEVPSLIAGKRIGLPHRAAAISEILNRICKSTGTKIS